MDDIKITPAVKIVLRQVITQFHHNPPPGGDEVIHMCVGSYLYGVVNAWDQCPCMIADNDELKKLYEQLVQLEYPQILAVLQMIGIVPATLEEIAASKRADNPNPRKAH